MSSHTLSPLDLRCVSTLQNTPVLQTPSKYFVPHLTSVLGLELALHLRHNQLQQRIYTSVFYKTPTQSVTTDWILVYPLS